MKRPEVTLENQENVYDYYALHQQPRLKALAYYALLAHKYQPDVHYAPGAKETLEEKVRNGQNFLIAINHLTNTHDQFIAAGTAWRSKLRPHIGHMRVIGKDELFTEEKQRKKIDVLGGIPAFRLKDHPDTSQAKNLRAAGENLVKTVASRLVRGDDVGIFPEGTHNLQNPRVLQQINSGIGYMAQAAYKRGGDFDILPIGISYGGDELTPTEFTHASVYIETPLSHFDYLSKPYAIRAEVRDSLQTAVDNAHAIHEAKKQN